MATKTITAPMLKDLDNEALRNSYKTYRALAYNNAQIAASGAANIRKCAAQMGRLMKWIEICEAIARKRGISLVVAEG